ncbi:MAG: hypothetical protein O3C48_08120 [Crenarchaeota archaeon]|nr:hypothetical protein [Thermoproteota archaeon]
MNKEEKEYFETLSSQKKIMYILRSEKEFGGPQSSKQINEILGFKKKNLDSSLSKMVKNGMILRIGVGVYKFRGDQREPENKTK